MGQDHASSHSFRVPADYLITLPNYLLDANGRIDPFYAPKLGLDESEASRLQHAVDDYIAVAKAAEKDQSKLITEPNGDCYLVIGNTADALREAQSVLASEVSAVSPEKGELLIHLLRSSPFLPQGGFETELAFTEFNKMPALTVKRKQPGAASVDEIIYLDGSPEQKAQLSARFGHVLNASASVDEMQEGIKAAQERKVAFGEVLKSLFHQP